MHPSSQKRNAIFKPDVIMLASLILPVVLASVALFFASFLSWMVVQLHKGGWKKVDKEDELMDAVRKCESPVGSYMFSGCKDAAEMKREADAKKWEAGACGIMTIYPKVNPERNLDLAFLCFLVIQFCLGYQATIVIKLGIGFREVFRFV